ncbi:MAG: DNA polymerase II [Thermoproteota archaeon]
MTCRSKERVEFLVLDSTYEVVGREPVIILWGITSSGERIVLQDSSFRPYFYALLREDADVDGLVSKIHALSMPKSPIIGVEQMERRYFGRKRKVLKITTVIPEYVREYREKVKLLDGVEDVLEADIRFAMRYLIDKGLFPFHMYEAEVEEVGSPSSYRVDRVYRLCGDIEPIREPQPKLPELRVVAFDIEVYNPRGTPSPHRDPVIIIAVRDSRGNEETFLADGKNDKPAIRDFVSYINDFDPDVIVGYNSNRFDWPYLIERSKIVGVKLDVTRKIGAVPAQSVYGHISVQGRLNVDLYDYAEEMYEVKVKSLEEVAEYLGVVKKSERVNVNWWDIPKYWDDPSKREILVKYALDDVRSTYGIAEKLLPFAVQLSAVTGVPLDQVGAMSVGFRLEWYLIRAAFEQGELVPNRVERPSESYRGAVVFKPLRGVHENVAVLDFSSMYPNIMIKYNVGPDTLVEDLSECDMYGGCNIAPEVGHAFRKQPDGFFKRVLKNLVELRRKVREEMKKYPPDSPEYRVLDERQRALKVLANASYGYTGWAAARWYCRKCAEAITAWGRNLILTAAEYARKLNLKVIYGDTDSLFVTYDPEKVKLLVEYIEKGLGFEVKIDKVYKRVFFTEAKKRYAGLLDDGRIDIVGFEAVRGDWCDLAREVQERVAEIVLGTGDVKKAIEYVKNVIRSLRSGKVELNKLVIWKTLTKRVEEYEHEAPHVAAARRMEEKGIKVSPGDKVGYVIVRGSGPVSKRAMPYFMVSGDQIDVNYYIDHQIVPAVLRILGYFGVTEKSLKAGLESQRSLLDFFAGKK